MDTVNIEARFLAEIHRRGLNDHYIDLDEEREILQFAIQKGVSLPAARDLLTRMCRREGYVVESAVVRELGEFLEEATTPDGLVDEPEFHRCVALCRQAVRGRKNEIQVKRLVLQVIADSVFQIRTGLLHNWHSRIKREVGLE